VYSFKKFFLYIFILFLLQAIKKFASYIAVVANE